MSCPCNGGGCDNHGCERSLEIDRNRRAAEEALHRLEVQEQTEAALAKLPPVGDFCEACGRTIEWDGHTEASHLRVELELEQSVTKVAIAALTAIAGADYRGNRPPESSIAWKALEYIKTLRKEDGDSDSV